MNHLRPIPIMVIKIPFPFIISTSFSQCSGHSVKPAELITKVGGIDEEKGVWRMSDGAGRGSSHGSREIACLAGREGRRVDGGGV